MLVNRAGPANPPVLQANDDDDDDNNNYNNDKSNGIVITYHRKPWVPAYNSKK